MSRHQRYCSSFCLVCKNRSGFPSCCLYTAWCWSGSCKRNCAALAFMGCSLMLCELRKKLVTYYRTNNKNGSLFTVWSNEWKRLMHWVGFFFISIFFIGLLSITIIFYDLPINPKNYWTGYNWCDSHALTHLAPQFKSRYIANFYQIIIMKEITDTYRSAFLVKHLLRILNVNQITIVGCFFALIFV